MPGLKKLRNLEKKIVNGKMSNIKKDQLDKLLFVHATAKECAAAFECSVDTLENYIKKNENMGFSEYAELKKGLGKLSLRRLQYQSCANGSVPMQIWLGKQWLGQRDPDKDQQQIEPNKILRVTLFDDSCEAMEEADTLANAILKDK